MKAGRLPARRSPLARDAGPARPEEHARAAPRAGQPERRESGPRPSRHHGGSCARELVAASPDEHEDYRVAADCWQATEDRARFHVTIAKVVALEPDSTGLLRLKGVAARARDHDGLAALRFCQEALAEDPKFVRARVVIVVLLPGIDGACAEMNELAAMNPNHQIVTWMGPTLEHTHNQPLAVRARASRCSVSYPGLRVCESETESAPRLGAHHRRGDRRPGRDCGGGRRSRPPARPAEPARRHAAHQRRLEDPLLKRVRAHLAPRVVSPAPASARATRKATMSSTGSRRAGRRTEGCRGRDLNPHPPCGGRDFKSPAFTDFATPADRSGTALITARAQGTMISCRGCTPPPDIA